MDDQKPTEKLEEELSEDEKRDRKIAELEQQAWEFETKAQDYRNAAQKQTLLAAARSRRHEASVLRGQRMD